MKLQVVVLALLMSWSIAGRAQVRAGSPELKLYEQIAAEMNTETKLDLIRSFETQFPTSRIIGSVYLIAVDVYRTKQDRVKINEYAEKALAADQGNVTAMMLLARNYAIEAKNLDRAMELAQRAIQRTEELAKQPLPTGYSETQWKDYLKGNSDSARQILDYVSSIKKRSDTSRGSTSNAVTTTTNSAATDGPKD